MKKALLCLLFASLLSGCAVMKYNPDTGEASYMAPRIFSQNTTVRHEWPDGRKTVVKIERDASWVEEALAALAAYVGLR